MSLSSCVMLTIQILQGLLTPVIAATTVYIAWQQWKLNERNSVMQRYERRLRIYQEVVAFLLLVNRDFNPEFSDLVKFGAATAESRFLFGSDVENYLTVMSTRAFKLWHARKEYRDITQAIPPGYDHNKVVEELTEQEQWFFSQPQVATEKFKPYLDISK